MKCNNQLDSKLNSSCFCPRQAEPVSTSIGLGVLKHGVFFTHAVPFSTPAWAFGEHWEGGGGRNYLLTLVLVHVSLKRGWRSSIWINTVLGCQTQGSKSERKGSTIQRRKESKCARMHNSTGYSFVTSAADCLFSKKVTWTVVSQECPYGENARGVYVPAPVHAHLSLVQACTWALTPPRQVASVDSSRCYGGSQSPWEFSVTPDLFSLTGAPGRAPTSGSSGDSSSELSPW